MKPTSSHCAIELGLARDHRVKKRAVGVRRAGGLGVVARDDVIGERATAINISARGEELEGADADVARGDAGEHGTRQRRLAPDRLAGRHGGERSGGRDAERRHRLADDVFAQDRAESGAAVAVAARRASGPSP